MASSSDAPSDNKKTSSVGSPPARTVDPENPFIAFRRFADSQISSLLQSVIGLPSLFSQPESSNRWPSIDDFVGKRREAMLRAQQELIEELERDTRESVMEKDNTVERQQEEMQKWGALLDAAKVDRSKERQDPTRQALAGHEKLGWDGKQRTEAKTAHLNETTKDRDERFSVSTPEGTVHLKRVVDRWDEGQGFWMAEDDPRLEFNRFTGQDPLSDSGHALSWLLTDDYSPLYLDRTLPYKLHQSFYKCDADDSYFRGDYHRGDLYPRFAPTSVVRHDPRIVERVNWRAAFHDLLAVHHQGYLPQRDQSEKTINDASTMNVGAWMDHLVHTGSLGPQWHKLSGSNSVHGPYCFGYGNLTEAWAVPRFMGQLSVRDTKGRFPLASFGTYERKNDSLPLISASPGYNNGSVGLQESSADQQNLLSGKELQAPSLFAPEARDQSNVFEEAVDDDWLSYRPAFTEAAISLIRNPDTEQSTLRAVDRVLRVIENPDLEDEVEGILEKAFGDMDPEAPKISKRLFRDLDQLLHSNYLDEWKTAKDAVDSEHPAVYGVTLDEPEHDDSPSGPRFLPFSSSSSSSHRQHSSDESRGSILSTLTTVESRTLPDGRTQTRRILKKRFANGTEENSESVETESGRNDHRVFERFVMEKVEEKAPENPQPAAIPTEGKRKIGGWFWY